MISLQQDNGRFGGVSQNCLHHPEHQVIHTLHLIDVGALLLRAPTIHAHEPRFQALAIFVEDIGTMGLRI